MASDSTLTLESAGLRFASTSHGAHGGTTSLIRATGWAHFCLFAVFFCIWPSHTFLYAGEVFTIIQAKSEPPLNVPVPLPTFKELVPGVYFNKEKSIVIMTKDNSCEELWRELGGENEKVFSCAEKRYLLIISDCKYLSDGATRSIVKKCTGYIAQQLETSERNLPEMVFDSGETNGRTARRWVNSMNWFWDIFK